MSSDQQALWNGLHSAGLMKGDLPPEETSESPWFIRLMLGVAGWFAALFLLGFFILAFEIFKSEDASLFIGMLLCVAAVFISRATEFEDFGQQFGFALSLTGQALILIGLADIHSGRSGQALLGLEMALIEVVLFVAIGSFIHRVWSSAAGLFALMFAMNHLGLFFLTTPLLLLITAVVWMNEFALPGHGKSLRALGYGAVSMAVLSLLYFPLMNGIGVRLFRVDAGVRPDIQQWLGVAISVGVMGFLVVRLLAGANLGLKSKAGLAAIFALSVIAVASFWAPGLSVVVVAILVGFAHGNRVLLGLGILATLVYLSQYYYWLEITLLYKSILLIFTGGLLIVFRYAMNWLWAGNRAAGENDA